MGMENRRIIGVVVAIAACLFLTAFSIVMWILLHRDNNERAAEEKLEGLRTYVEDAAAKDTETTFEAAPNVSLMEQLGITVPNKKIDWKKLEKENGDIYAWLYIPGTNVDYPVLQHGEENNYYVDHNLDGSRGYPGCLTTQVEYSSKDFMDFNTCIYGHNMKSGTMFRSLHEYEDALFFKDNGYAYIFTPDATYVYRIFAAYKFGNALIPYAYDFSTRSGCQEYIDEIFSIRDMNAHFRDDVRLTPQNHILTLSTCTTPSDDNYRWLVQGVMVNDPTLPDEEIQKTVFAAERQ